MTPKKIINKFNKCKTDVEKWKWIINHQEYNILVMLDNDCTFITVDRENECEIGDFDNFIGWKEGVSDLLHAINVKHEFV